MDCVSYWCSDAGAELTPVAEYDVDTPFFDHDKFGLPSIMSAFDAEDDYEMPRSVMKDHAAKLQGYSSVMAFDVEGVLCAVPPIFLGSASADQHQEPCSPRSSSETNSHAEIPCASPSSTDVSTADVHEEMPDTTATAIKLESTADTRKARALPPKTKRRRGTSAAASKANKKQKRMQRRPSGDDSSDGEELRSFQATICFSIVKSWDDFSQNALGEINQHIRQMEAKAVAAAATAAEAAAKEQDQQDKQVKQEQDS